MNYLRSFILITLWAYSCASLSLELEAELIWEPKIVMSFPVTGIINQLNVEVGDRVKANYLLASLDRSLLESQLIKAKHGVDKYTPALYDAQQDYEQSQELYDRTVFSEVELQKSSTRLAGIKAEKAMADADFETAKWKHQHAQLIAPYDAIVIYNNLTPGLIITKDNQSELRIELVQTGIRRVQLYVDSDTLNHISMRQKTSVIIGTQRYAGIVKRIELKAEKTNRYAIQVEFSHPQSTSLTSQPIKVTF